MGGSPRSVIDNSEPPTQNPGRSPFHRAGPACACPFPLGLASSSALFLSWGILTGGVRLVPWPVGSRIAPAIDPIFRLVDLSHARQCPMENSTILEMKGVRKSFGTVVALDDVNLQLNSSEIHGLLGGNGAGKTTLMNVLYGLYKPNDGQIYLRDEEVEILSPKDAISCGMKCQQQFCLTLSLISTRINLTGFLAYGS